MLQGMLAAVGIGDDPALRINLEGNQEERKEATLQMEKALARVIDVDNLTKKFERFAGLDDVMTKDEFDEFIKESHLSGAVSRALWHMLDNDRSGEVSRDEFRSCLRRMQATRAWLRFCPTCDFTNDCPYCLECNFTCQRCNERVFCARCWAQHPGRQTAAQKAAVEIDDAEAPPGHPVFSKEWARQTFVLRPLEWAYNSNIGLLVLQKQQIRITMQEQQRLHEEATAAELNMPELGR